MLKRVIGTVRRMIPLSIGRTPRQETKRYLMDVHIGNEDAGTPAARFDEAYFAAHRVNAYQRLLGVKGFVGSWLRKRPVQPTSILDIGCGMGFFFRDVRFIPERCGCDVSPVALRKARQTDPSATFSLIEPDGTLPFSEQCFDVITCFDVIEHVADDRNVFVQARKRMIPGGIFILSTPNPRSLGHRVKKGRWFGYRDKTHINILSPEELAARLRLSGFIIDDIRYDGFWDVPYFTPLKIVEQLLVQLPSVLAFRYGRIGSPYLGENTWILARAR